MDPTDGVLIPSRAILDLAKPAAAARAIFTCEGPAVDVAVDAAHCSGELNAEVTVFVRREAQAWAKYRVRMYGAEVIEVIRLVPYGKHDHP